MNRDNIEAYDFHRESWNTPVGPNPLMEYGLRYHRECEAYDQTVCKRRDRQGIALPDGKEHKLVNENSQKVRERLMGELLKAGLATQEDVVQVMRKAIEIAGEPFRKEWNSIQRKKLDTPLEGDADET